MGLIALEIPPGIYRNGTEYQSRGRFYNADLWRFHEGTSRPIGGWVVRSSAALQGKARRAVTWISTTNAAWTGIGTHSHLYAVSRSGAVNDITPVSSFTVGRPDALFGGGYGEGLYGAGLYGTPRLGSSSIIPASVWSLDNWGEYLVGTMGETIFEWQLNTSIVAVPITNAPTAEAILVTAERIMLALSADSDPRAVDWCDAEDNTDWTPTATNLAGGTRLQTNGGLKCGRNIQGASLLFTDTDVHKATYVGLPQVYAFERLETGCGVASKGSPVVAANGQVFWFGVNGFWRFNGYVDALPCDVFDYVFSDLNRTQISKVSGWHNSLWGEVWWHYPSAASEEVDRYVFFNYREGHWNIGELDRLCGVDRAPLADPQLVGDDGYVYSHETGDLRDGRQPFVTSGPVELGEGDRTMEVHAYIPDENTLGSLAASFATADYPMDTPQTVAAVTATAKTDLRFSARRVAVTYTGDADADFRAGRVRFDVKAGAGR
jgi:hypothetical protein